MPSILTRVSDAVLLCLFNGSSLVLTMFCRSWPYIEPHPDKGLSVRLTHYLALPFATLGSQLINIEHIFGSKSVTFVDFCTHGVVK